MNQKGEVWLLDANIYIEAHKRYYAFDICSGLSEQDTSMLVYSGEK